MELKGVSEQSSSDSFSDLGSLEEGSRSVMNSDFASESEDNAAPSSSGAGTMVLRNSSKAGQTSSNVSGYPPQPAQVAAAVAPQAVGGLRPLPGKFGATSKSASVNSAGNIVWKSAQPAVGLRPLPSNFENAPSSSSAG